MTGRWQFVNPIKMGLAVVLLGGISSSLSGEERERHEGRGGKRSSRAIYQEIPPALTRTVSFNTDVKPILLENCTRCHGAKKQKADLRLDTEKGIMAGTEDGPVIKPGRSGASLLVRSIAGVGVESDKVMPPKDDLLTKDEIGIIRAWIDQGAKFDGK